MHAVGRTDTQSMSRPDNCYDNAFMESCFGTLKTELAMEVYADVRAAQEEIYEYLGYYNFVSYYPTSLFAEKIEGCLFRVCFCGGALAGARDDLASGIGFEVTSLEYPGPVQQCMFTGELALFYGLA
jgi:hypothetical protein